MIHPASTAKFFICGRKHTAHFTSLHFTSQCTLCKAHATANAPESEHVYFILHIEHSTLHTTNMFIPYFANVSLYTATIQNFPELASRFTWQNIPWSIEEVSMKKNSHRIKSFCSVTLPYRCNSYVLQVSQKWMRNVCFPT